MNCARQSSHKIEAYQVTQEFMNIEVNPLGFFFQIDVVVLFTQPDKRQQHVKAVGKTLWLAQSDPCRGGSKHKCTNHRKDQSPENRPLQCEAVAYQQILSVQYHVTVV